MNEKKVKIIKRVVAVVLLCVCVFMSVERYVMKSILDYYYPDTDHFFFYNVSAGYALFAFYFLAVAIKAQFLPRFKKNDKPS